MAFVWSQAAEDSLFEILNYYEIEVSSDFAESIENRIYAQIDKLEGFEASIPKSAIYPATRKLVISKLPYVAFIRERTHGLWEVVDIVHTSRKLPKKIMLRPNVLFRQSLNRSRCLQFLGKNGCSRRIYCLNSYKKYSKLVTIPGLAGFAMKVKANSVTFPDGSRVGTLVVSPATADKLPMAPPAGGAQFGVPAWTVQPAGIRC